MTLAEKERALRAELAALRDVPARLAWLIERARVRPLLAAELRVDANRIEGCLARLWFAAEWREGRCWFRSESDSLMVKAVAGLLTDLYSGCAPGEIVNQAPEFLGEIGLAHHFTANRRNAMGRLWERMRAFAAEPPPPKPG